MCLRETLLFPTESQATCSNDLEHRIAMEPIKGKWASSLGNLGYTELFSTPEVTSVFFSSCDSVLGDSLVFHQANRGSLRV